ncbi:MAG: hypothetical protein Kow0037_20740 [Calditrichia bacterium]
MKNNVLITYGWNRVAYNMCRALAKEGIQVHVGDNSPLAMTRYSRYSHKFFTYPSFYQSPDKYIKFISQYADQHQIECYLPVHEETFIASKYKSVLFQAGLKVPVDSLDKMKIFHLKDKSLALAKQLGVRVPESIKPASFEDAKSFAEKYGFPVVIKTIQSNSAKGVFYAKNLEELSALWESVKNSDFLLQQYFAGHGYGVSVLANQGQIRAMFTHKRLVEKTYTGGTSVLRISTRNEELEEYTKKLVEHVKWHGVAMFEFKYNEETKNGCFIEINPRFWGSLALPLHAGINFPYMLYRMAMDGDVEPQYDYKEGISVKWLLGSAIATVDKIRNKQWSKIFQTDYKVAGYDDLYWDDPLPFFMQSFYYLSKLIRTRNFNPSDESSFDINCL